jgi:secondary thiamine-phosphate synthase enzyme
LKIYKQKIDFETKTQFEFVDITDRVQETIDNSGVREGQALIFIPHTTMGMLINYNEPMLLQDFMKILYRLAPVDDQYSHDMFELKRSKMADGRSNGHSHCKSFLTGVNQTVPIEKGKMMLGERQHIFIVEFDGARHRDAIIQVMGI